MHHLLKMTDQGQHGEHGFHHHALVPLAPLTQFQIGGVPLTGMETHITQDDLPPEFVLHKLPTENGEAFTANQVRTPAPVLLSYSA